MDYQNFNMDDIHYLTRNTPDEDEPAIMHQFCGDVLVLETQMEQTPWLQGSYDYDYFDNNNDVSYYHQQDEVHDEHMFMQNEELTTWLGYYPCPNTPLQQAAPFLPDYPVDPITAAAAPPPLSEAVPLPPSLENPPPGSTAMEYSEAFPSVHAENMSHVFSGGSETAGIAAPASLLPVKFTGETSAGASTSTDKEALLPVDGGRKRKIEVVEVDDDSETTQPAEPNKTRKAKMHNLAERRRRRRTSDRFNTLFDLSPNCRKGSKNRDDRMEKVITYVRRLMHENEILRQRQQYREMLIASQPPNGMMCPYMPPSAIPATPTFPAPPAVPQEHFTVPLAEYLQMKAWQTRQLAQPRPQQPGGSSSGSEDTGSHQSG